MSDAVAFRSSQGEALVFNKDHEVILQTLDRESNGLFLPMALFEPTVEKWNGVPVLFAADHVDPTAYDQDPAQELARVGGKVVGTMANARIDKVGHPRLMGTLVLSEDATVETFIAEGKLSPSTAFRCDQDDNGKLVGVVEPHHVLLFIEGGVSQPGDRGAFILNTERNNIMPEDKLDTAWASFKATILALFKPTPPPEKDPKMATPPNSSNNITPERGSQDLLPQELADLKKSLADAQSTAQTFKDELAAVMGKLAAMEVEKKDAAWTTFKTHVPSGLLADEPKARADWEADSATFALKVIAFLEQRAPAGPEEGQENTPPPPEPDPLAPYLTVEAPVPAPSTNPPTN